MSVSKQFLFTLLTAFLLSACEEPPQWKKEELATVHLGSAPTISSISNQTTAEDTSLSGVAVTISDAESTLSCQSLTFISGNPTLVPSNKITATGTAPNCTLSMTPEAHQVGYTDITVTIRDPHNGKASTQFSLQVTPVNDPPSIGSISAKTTTKNTTSLPIALPISDIDSALSCAMLSGTSSNQTIVANSGLNFSGIYPNCSLSVTPVSNKSGTLTLTVQVTDGTATSSRIFPFEVLDINTPPTISSITDRTITEDFAPFQIPFTISDGEAGLDCQTSVTLLSSNASLVSTSEMQLSGAAPNCVLQISSQPNKFGSTNISLVVSDGSVQVTEIFNLNVLPVNDPPTISAFTDATVTTNSTYIVDFTIDDSDSTLTCSSSHVSVSSSNSSLVPNSQILISGTAPDCSASITPTTNSWGTTLIAFEVSDGSLSATSNLNLRFQSDLLLTPSASIVVTGGIINFTTTGGSGSGYTYSIDSGGGSIDPASGEYTAPATASVVTVRVTDMSGDYDVETIEVYEALAIDPLSLVLGVNLTKQFNTTGGYGDISFSVTMGNGTMSATGLYSASNVPGTVQVTATDELGGTASAMITIVSQLTLSPTTLDLPVFSTAIFSGGGGQTAFSFSLASGDGSINSTSGVLTAGSTIGSATVEINDQSSQSAQSTVTYIRPIKITSGNAHTCALYNNGRVKCWGSAANGKLGQGNTTSLGDSAGELGGAIPFVNLGTGRTVTDISAGANHNCAILDDGSVKCWGLNSSGQLGYGDTLARGDGANEMVNSLPTVNLGTGRTAKSIAAGSASTCAILDNDSLKCWGAGTSGILGKGNTTSLGDGANEMGDPLTPVNLGTGRTVKKIALSKSANSACAILDNNALKCWGINSSGRLGYGNTLTLGDGANEMGDSLQTVNLGTGKYALEISLGNIHTCALLNDSTVKCWGEASNGQIGLGNTTDRGDNANEMGDSLAVVNLGTGFTPSGVHTSNTTTCVTSTAGTMKCFGSATSGIRLSGNTTAAGTTTASMGNNLGLSNIGSEQITTVAMGIGHACAILSNDRIKCWGAATSGALLNQGTTVNLGDATSETGNSLPFVNH